MTNKRRPTLTTAQMAFTFAAPEVPTHAGDLAGLAKMMASSVARMLKEDLRSREVIAAELSALTGEEISRFMLDSWAAEGREQHNISAARWLALISVTSRHDVLDTLTSKIGARVLVGEEIHAARLGHLMSKRREIEQQIKALEATVLPIDRSQFE